MEDFEEMLFVCITITTLLFVGVLICHAIGVCIMRLRDLRTGRKHLYILRRVR